MFKKSLMSLVFAGLLGAGALSAEVVVRIGPPRPLVERRIARPGARYVWTNGYQRWDGRGYVWQPGAWVLPPRPRAHWREHRWVRRHGDWVFVEGGWR